MEVKNPVDLTLEHTVKEIPLTGSERIFSYTSTINNILAYCDSIHKSQLGNVVNLIIYEKYTQNDLVNIFYIVSLVKIEVPLFLENYIHFTIGNMFNPV